MLNRYQQNLAALRSGAIALDAAAASTGMAYLNSELTIAEQTLTYPLSSSTWRRDIPLITGGGWADNESVRFVGFRSPKDEVPGGQSNDIRVYRFNRNQDIYPLLPWEGKVDIELIDGLRMAQMGIPAQALLDEGVKLGYEHEVNKRVYQGINGYSGLVNSPFVTSYALSAVGTQNGVSAGTTPSMQFANKTPVQILADFNNMATAILNASGNSEDALPNRFLVPYSVYGALTTMMTVGGVGGGESINQYVKRQYFGAGNGEEVQINRLPYWLDTAGPSGTSVIIAYRYDPTFLSFRVAVDLSPLAQGLELSGGSYLKIYGANLGVPVFRRPSTIGYFYGA